MRSLVAKTLPGPLKQYAKSVRQRISPRALILLYHRVIDLAEDPQLLSVSPKHFAEQMDVLHRFGRTVPLSKVTQDLYDGRLGKSQVVVTFDDGYADNLHNARPILERFAIPATVFVTSGYVGSENMYWWDELQNVILRSERLPEYLDLTPAGVSFEWRFTQHTEFSEKDFVTYGSWNVAQSPLPTERHQLYMTLHRLIRPLPPSQRQEVMHTLRTWADFTASATPIQRPMTHSELNRLVEANLVEVGAHTVNHPVLSALPMKVQQTELSESRKSLEGIVNRPVTTFAYPFGTRNDYTPSTVIAARQAGFRCACSNFPGLIRARTDNFQLPRHIVRDWNGDIFEQHLREWLLEW